MLGMPLFEDVGDALRDPLDELVRQGERDRLAHSGVQARSRSAYPSTSSRRPSGLPPRAPPEGPAAPSATLPPRGVFSTPVGGAKPGKVETRMVDRSPGFRPSLRGRSETAWLTDARLLECSSEGTLFLVGNSAIQ